MLTLHEFNKKSDNRTKKRRGRGNASGKGNYSTRGIKGQRSRSGGKSGLALRSIKSYLLRIPKIRGFKSIHNKMAVVNLSGLNSNFKDGETINARALLKAKLISTIDNGLKILSSGEINKKFIVEANAFSKTAKAAIEKAGGEAKLVGQKKVDDKKKKNKKEAPAEAAPKEEKPAAEVPKK